MKIDLHKIYHFTPLEPAPSPEHLPVGGDVFYECQECKVVLTSVPYIKSACDCGNLAGAGGKIKVNRPEAVRVMRGKLK